MVEEPICNPLRNHRNISIWLCVLNQKGVYATQMKVSRRHVMGRTGL